LVIAEAERLCGVTDLDSGPREEPRLAELIDSLVAFVRRFVVLTTSQGVVIALWVLHTWTIDAVDVTPFLAITSAEMRSGKTRLLEVLNLLVRKPWRAVSPSEAVLFRKIDRESPTLLLDEVDAIFGLKAGDHEGIRALLNAGNRRGQTVDRVARSGGEMKLESFEVFCARALTGIGELPSTVADRSIPIRLKRRGPGEIIAPFRYREVEPIALGLREQIERWASGALKVLQEARPDVPAELDDRTADGVEPLLAIADLAGPECGARAREAVTRLAGEKGRDVEISLGVRLLRDSHELFVSRGADRLSSEDVCQSLIKLDEAPWPEINHGRPLTVRRLARLLNPYGIVSRTIRFSNAASGEPTTAKGYYRADFEDAWGRLLAPQDVTTSQTNEEAGSPSIPNRHSPIPVTDEEAAAANAGAAGDDVTDQPHHSGAEREELDL
jgi:hypothetical protein